MAWRDRRRDAYEFRGIGFAGATEKLTLLETKAFLDGLRGGRCGSPMPMDGMSVKNK